ncbi:MAG: hypothetical protein AMXMBFR4_22270 [Candidatus Hydrogenedentota bacterium]
MPRGHTPGKPAKSRAKKRRTRAQVESILSEIGSLTSAGSTLTAALKKLGVSYSNYSYWMKRQRSAAVEAGGRGGRPHKSSVLDTLQAMTNNRARRQQLEKQLQQLDTQFKKLKRKLEQS